MLHGSPSQIPELVYQPSIIGLDSAGLTALIERVLAKFQPAEATALVEVLSAVSVWNRILNRLQLRKVAC